MSYETSWPVMANVSLYRAVPGDRFVHRGQLVQVADPASWRSRSHAYVQVRPVTGLRRRRELLPRSTRTDLQVPTGPGSAPAWQRLNASERLSLRPDGRAPLDIPLTRSANVALRVPKPGGLHVRLALHLAAAPAGFELPLAGLNDRPGFGARALEVLHVLCAGSPLTGAGDLLEQALARFNGPAHDMWLDAASAHLELDLGPDARQVAAALAPSWPGGPGELFTCARQLTG